MTLEHCRGFVYASSTMGVTGARDAVSDLAPGCAAGSVKSPTFRSAWASVSRSGAQAAEIARYADGVIVGSAIVSAADEGQADRQGADRRTRRRRRAATSERLTLTPEAVG